MWRGDVHRARVVERERGPRQRLFVDERRRQCALPLTHLDTCDILAAAVNLAAGRALVGASSRSQMPLAAAIGHVRSALAAPVRPRPIRCRSAAVAAVIAGGASRARLRRGCRHALPPASLRQTVLRRWRLARNARLNRERRLRGAPLAAARLDARQLGDRSGRPLPHRRRQRRPDLLNRVVHPPASVRVLAGLGRRERRVPLLCILHLHGTRAREMHVRHGAESQTSSGGRLSINRNDRSGRDSASDDAR